MSGTVTRKDFEEVVFSSNEETQKRFKETFNDEIEEFFNKVFRAYEEMIALDTKLPTDMRTACVRGFLFYALQNLLVSFHLFISGYQVPAGNLMRQYGESISVALLFSHPQIDDFQRFENNRTAYNVRESVGKVSRKRNLELLQIDEKAWQEFMKITKWYDKYSHANLMAIANTLKFSEPGRLILGSVFDPAEEKLSEYRKELRLRTSACGLLFEVTRRVEQLLTRR